MNFIKCRWADYICKFAAERVIIYCAGCPIVGSEHSRIYVADPVQRTCYIRRIRAAEESGLTGIVVVSAHRLGNHSLNHQLLAFTYIGGQFQLAGVIVYSRFGQRYYVLVLSLSVGSEESQVSERPSDNGYRAAEACVYNVIRIDNI